MIFLNGAFWCTLYFWATTGPLNVAGPRVTFPPNPLLDGPEQTPYDKMLLRQNSPAIIFSPKSNEIFPLCCIRSLLATTIKLLTVNWFLRGYLFLPWRTLKSRIELSEMGRPVHLRQCHPDFGTRTILFVEGILSEREKVCRSGGFIVRGCCRGSCLLWGVYTIQQTSSKLPANVFKIHVLMLDVCWINTLLLTPDSRRRWRS